ncbi:MAG: PqqD family protein [Syntrophales bacterium]
MFRKEGDGAYLYNSDSGNLMHANMTGARLFELCDGRNTVEAMTSQLAAAYDAPGKLIEQDVKSFLTSMLEKSFLKRKFEGADKSSRLHEQLK